MASKKVSGERRWAQATQRPVSATVVKITPHTQRSSSWATRPARLRLSVALPCTCVLMDLLTSSP
jgi:hypothetical protein